MVKIIEWECPHYKEKLRSSSLEHHKMDMCKYGESGIDLEKEYCRVIGDAKILKEITK